MAEAGSQEQPESRLDYVLRQGNVLFYRQRALLSELSGVPRSTINKVLDGTRKNSRSSTIDNLYNVMRAKEDSVNQEKMEARAAQRKVKT